MKVLKRLIDCALLFGLLFSFPTSAFAQCTNPTGETGEIIYNESYGQFAGCMADNTWQAFHVDIRPDCPNIGDLCTDGSVYAYTAIDGRGFVADIYQSSATNFSVTPGNNDEVNPSSSSDGLENLSNITVPLSNLPAMELCANLDRHGHQDWYLPSIGELQSIAGSSPLIDPNLTEPIGTDYIWSSTETGSAASRVRMDGMASGSGWDDVALPVRCVRKSFGDELINLSEFATSDPLPSVPSANTIAISGSGDHAYIGTYTDAIAVIDISDPTNPIEMGTTGTLASLDGIRDIDVSGDYVYAAVYSENALTVIDVSDPTNPVEAGTTGAVSNLTPAGLTISGNYAYVTSQLGRRLFVIDISDPTTPTVVGQTPYYSNMYYARNVEVHGSYAFVTATNSGTFNAIDISNPTSPVRVDSINLTNTGLVAIPGDGSYAIVVGSTFGGQNLTAVSISDPSNLTVISSSGTIPGFSPSAIALKGNYAYLSSMNGSVVAADISEPDQPKFVASTGILTNLDDARDLDIFGSLAYLPARTPGRLTMINIVDAPDYCSPNKIGEIIYNSSENVFQGCVDDRWIAFHDSGSGGGGCTSPTGATGEIIYNTDHNVFQGCSEDGWFAFHE